MTSSEEFRQFGTAMINYVADYLDNIRDRRVVPEVGGGCQGITLQTCGYSQSPLSSNMVTHQLENGAKYWQNV